MPADENEIKVRLIIYGFTDDPEEVTVQLGLSPTLTWCQGDIISPTTRKHEENGWRLDSPASSNVPLDDQIGRLLALLAPAQRKISEMSEKCTVEFSCIVYAWKYVPSLNFSKEFLDSISRLGASIDIDLYCLIEDGSG